MSVDKERYPKGYAQDPEYQESPLKPNEPIRLESEEVFDSDLLGRPDPELFMDDPMKMYADLIGGLRSMTSNFMRPRPAMVYDPPAQEHKVRIFRVYDQMNLAEVESQIESILNEGWCCHHPVVVGDFLIMDFSRIKESEENEKV